MSSDCKCQCFDADVETLILAVDKSSQVSFIP